MGLWVCGWGCGPGQYLNVAFPHTEPSFYFFSDHNQLLSSSPRSFSPDRRHPPGRAHPPRPFGGFYPSAAGAPRRGGGPAGLRLDHEGEGRWLKHGDPPRGAVCCWPPWPVPPQPLLIPSPPWKCTLPPPLPVGHLHCRDTNPGPDAASFPVRKRGGGRRPQPLAAATAAAGHPACGGQAAGMK